MSHHHTYYYICHPVWHLISGSTNVKYSKIVSKAYTFSSSRGFWMVSIWPIWAKICMSKINFQPPAQVPPLPRVPRCGIRVPTPPCMLMIYGFDSGIRVTPADIYFSTDSDIDEILYPQSFILIFLSLGSPALVLTWSVSRLDLT